MWCNTSRWPVSAWREALVSVAPHGCIALVISVTECKDYFFIFPQHLYQCTVDMLLLQSSVYASLDA